MTSQQDLDAYYELIMQLVDEAGQVSYLWKIDLYFGVVRNRFID